MVDTASNHYRPPLLLVLLASISISVRSSVFVWLVDGMTLPPKSKSKSKSSPRLRLTESSRRVGNVDASTGIDPTGHKVWDAGRAFSRILGDTIENTTDNADDNILRGKRVLELGSGTGIVGLTCALHGASFVCLTDGSPDLLPTLRSNAFANDLAHKVQVRSLKWGDADDILPLVSELGPFDLVVGSDLLYSPESFGDLVDTLEGVCEVGRTEVWLAYPERYTEGIFFGMVEGVLDEVDRVEIEPAVFWSKLLPRG